MMLRASVQAASTQTIEFGTNATPEHAKSWVLERLLPHFTDAVVEVKYDSTAFEVTRSYHGALQPGERLPFVECRRVLRMGSTEAYLSRLMENTPIVDAPVTSLERDVTLDSLTNLEALPTPSPDARIVILLVVRPREEGRWWGFASQTLNDKTFRIGA